MKPVAYACAIASRHMIRGLLRTAWDWATWEPFPRGGERS